MSVKEFITLMGLPAHQLRSFASKSAENRRLIRTYAEYFKPVTRKQILRAIA